MRAFVTTRAAGRLDCAASGAARASVRSAKRRMRRVEEERTVQVLRCAQDDNWAPEGRSTKIVEEYVVPGPASRAAYPGILVQMTMAPHVSELKRDVNCGGIVDGPE